MTQFNINVTGADAISRKLRQMKNHLGNMNTPMQQISVYLDKWVQDNFKGEGIKTGKKWKDLKGGFRRKKKGKKTFKQTNYQILSNTGNLKNSFKPFFSKTDAGVGSDIEYSAPHNYGLPQKGLPKRRILPLRKEVMPDVFKIMDWFLKVVIKKIGG